MTTTIEFQSNPDFYTTQEECAENLRKRPDATNPRYKNFTQTHFTAGDEEQFQTYRDTTNGNICKEDISLNTNLFVDQPFPKWEKYKDVQVTAVNNTFKYIFHKFKKGIFVKIVNNKLKVFLPFSNENFTNEWSDKIKVDPSKYSSINDFLKFVSAQQGYTFHPRSVNSNIEQWYANNCLIRFDFREGDSNVGNVKNMLETLCSKREIPDVEFFINRRDFPILTRDNTEPYNNIWGNKPLVSHNYPKYIPILSETTSKH